MVRIDLRNSFARIEYAYTWFDYAIALPFLALLPRFAGRALAKLRGNFHFALKRDWRAFSFEDSQLHLRTWQAYATICPHLNARKIRRLVRRRYIAQSLEEYETYLLIRGKFTPEEVEYINFDAVKSYTDLNPHTVFVTGHIGPSVMASVCISKFGIPLMGMSSNITRDERVHPAIQRFYTEKYRVFAQYTNEGSIVDAEGNTLKFFRHISKHGSVVIIGDLPPLNSSEQITYESFFNEIRGFAGGPRKLANHAGTKVIGFVCRYNEGRYQMEFSSPDENAYQFLEQQIAREPEQWWAADLLPLFPKAPD